MEARDVGEFATRLRRLREAASLTQEELAERAGLTAKAVGALERGERRRPYPHTVRVLSDALELDEAEGAALAAAARPGLAATASPTPAAVGPPLVGRRREVWDVVTALTTGPARLLTITGPGGVGKTRLALEAARRAASGFGQAVTVVELAAVRDPALVMASVAHRLGVPESRPREAGRMVAAHLGSRRHLLVLDNLEHLLPVAAEVGDLIEACPGLVVLVTSRAPLRLRVEQDYPLNPLSLPAGSDVASVSASGAGQMLLDRATAAAPTFALTDRTAPAIAAICRQLDGLPLALELAAAHARLLSADALLARLDQAVSSPRARDLPDRHSTVRATLDWSHDLLTLEEQTALRRLAVFAGGFTLDAAEAVVGGDVDTFAALSGLVDQSMVEARTDADERYRLLEPVRQYASGRLADSGETDDVADRHADWVCALGHEARSGLRTSDQARYLDLLQAEHGNLRAALDRLLAGGRLDDASRLLGDTWLSWALRGSVGEALEWVDRIRSHPEASRLSAADRAFLEIAEGGLRYATGDMAATAALAAQAADHARTSAPALLPDALLMLGSGQLFTGATDEAAKTLGAAAALPEADAWTRAHVRLAEGQRLLMVHELDDASRAMAEAERMARDLASPFTLAVVLNTQGTQALGSGDDDAALDRFLEASQLSADVNTMWTLVYALPGLATVAARRGQAGLAAVLFAAGATTSDASSLLVAFPPDLAFAEAARADVQAALDDAGLSAAAAQGHDVRPEDVPALAAQVRRRAQP